MDEIEFQHMYGEDDERCYYCDVKPESAVGTGLFSIELDEVGGVIKVLHLCRDCVARWY